MIFFLFFAKKVAFYVFFSGKVKIFWNLTPGVKHVTNSTSDSGRKDIS